MSVSARMSLRDDRLFDEYSFDSGQPSDEWENDHDVDEKLIDQYNVPMDEMSFEQINAHSTAHEESTLPSCNEESQTFNAKVKESFFSNQSSFVDYLSHLVPSFGMEDSKVTDVRPSFSTASYSKADITESPAKRSASSHSRCIIENPESIQDRRDDHKQFRGNRGRVEEDCTRDESTICSIEEISQISELTMDIIPTVAPEQKFAQCSALPTISEVQQFDSPIAAIRAAGVRGKARCSAGADTSTNKSEGNNDFIDFVFELVEDAVCKPIKTSKSERKQVFMDAFYEESKKVVKLATKNSSRDSFRQRSKHSRSSNSTKSTANRSRKSQTVVDDRDGSVTEHAEMSTHSALRSDHSRMKMVDKPPVKGPGLQKSFPLNDELTMDWSKMMSLAEKQLEAEENSIHSNMSEVSRMTEISSVYQSVRCDDSNMNDVSVMSNKISTKARSNKVSNFGTKTSIGIDQSNLKSSPVSSVSTSSSTHATLADEVVKELRELSALDSSSYEEEPRLLLTSTIFRFVRSLIPSFGESKEKSSEEEEQEERVFDEMYDEMSETSLPFIHKQNEILSMYNRAFMDQEEDLKDEEVAFKIIRFIAFIYAFVFWPSGIGRRTIPNKPLSDVKKNRVDSKPTSLLQLVSKQK